MDLRGKHAYIALQAPGGVSLRGEAIVLVRTLSAPGLAGDAQDGDGGRTPVCEAISNLTVYHGSTKSKKVGESRTRKIKINLNKRSQIRTNAHLKRLIYLSLLVSGRWGPGMMWWVICSKH